MPIFNSLFLFNKYNLPAKNKQKLAHLPVN
ncbi:hypothetical protein GKA53_05215 [Vibrio parahaemolyticus]|nr:hypothetical protein [Vibrio parahaemolyticus]EGQ8850107.1 hypothetical protein [Vibrio parahaemolyticus]EGQ8854298.1 hypothetical protein [Vibrio parahaemolyticus]EGQ8873544.1 hypothetical protein [Vibrio parahaemolyticus]EGQ8993258.1 hypothetical protein [Vibrio parahaemolyticus]